MRGLIIGVCVLFSIIFIVSCDSVMPASLEEDQLLDGPVSGLTGAEHRQFLLGDAAFNTEIFTGQSGLGPVFVATSCGSCHAGDGKGHPFTTLTRFGQSDASGNKFLAQGGPQLQHRALPGYSGERLPDGASSSRFVAPINTGLGFMELVSDVDLLAMADPEDIDGDGISGIVNWNTIPSYVKVADGAVSHEGKYITRFGKKASVYNLLQQTANAYNQDIGITSSFEPVDVYSHLEVDPEISTQTINNVVFYLQTLKAPIQRSTEREEVIKGKDLFVGISCEKCHKQTLRTGNSHIAALANKEFHPYSDLLLHDMGSQLDDGYTEGTAKTYEWRTAPLWGLGLSPNSQGGSYYLLHDGRAHSIEEAILWHGGEAASSRQSYEQLSDADKELLITFLKSL